MDKRRQSIFSIASLPLLLVMAGSILVSSCDRGAPQPVPSARVTPSAVTTGQTPTIEATPGLVISGTVLDEQGSGVENVQIYRNYSAYPGEVIATSDANGHFESEFSYIPGDEMVAVWAEKEGFKFEPEYYRFRHYYGYEQRALNFKAVQP